MTVKQDNAYLANLFSYGLISPDFIKVKENIMKNQPKRENILFLAPSIEYTQAVVRDLHSFLSKQEIPHQATSEVWHTQCIVTDFAYIDFIFDDPICWKPSIFVNRDAVFGKKELVQKAWEKYGVFTPRKCLDRYLLDLARKSTECDNPNQPTTYIPAIKNVYFNNPMTIVLWDDGTKTIVKCQDGDAYSKETGLALCISKKAFGNKGNFNDIFKKWIPEEEPDTVNDIPEAKAADEVVSAIEKMKATAREEISRLFNNAFKKLPKED